MFFVAARLEENEKQRTGNREWETGYLPRPLVRSPFPVLGSRFSIRLYLHSPWERAGVREASW